MERITIALIVVLRYLSVPASPPFQMTQALTVKPPAWTPHPQAYSFPLRLTALSNVCP